MTDAETTFDVIVIGGGPAGLSAALWCSDLGIRSVLIERNDDVGGQLRNIHNRIDNYLGLRVNDGGEMLEHFRRSIEGRDFFRRLRTEITAFDPVSKTLFFADGGSLSANYVIVATGVRRRKLGIPGEQEFTGRGIIESGARDKAQLQGKRVLIVGGGDAAIENALLLSEFAASVRVAFRKSRPSARDELLSSIRGRRNVELVPSTVLVELRGSDTVEHAKLRDLVTDVDREVPVDAVLIRIGVEPNTEFLRARIDLDDQGYVKVTAHTETSVSDIFAIGDVANPLAPTLATAVGDGAVAAKVIKARLSKI